MSAIIVTSSFRCRQVKRMHLNNAALSFKIIADENSCYILLVSKDRIANGDL